MKIPFNLLPASWGLRGKSREIAEAEYYLSGKELELKLVEIQEDDSIQRELRILKIQNKYGELSKLDLDLKIVELTETDQITIQSKILTVKHDHGVISDYDFDVELAKILFEKDSKELSLELLKIDKRHHKIEKQEYEKREADINEEPWVAMPSIKWDPADPSQSYFELDYNDHFVTYLKSNGYEGLADQVIVEKWLNDVCRSVAQDFIDEDPAFVSIAQPSTRKIVKRRKTKKIEYS
jgi:hypothetical protein